MAKFIIIAKYVQEMISKGHTYSTQSDTESILHLYEEIGPRCVEKLRGMFAFAIWDSKHHKLFIARDRVGIKPLFYKISDHFLIFGSELKVLLEHPHVDRDMDFLALDSYFAMSYITGDKTIFQGISKLLPGHYLIWENGKTQISKYWDLMYQPVQNPKVDDLRDEFMHLLHEAVRLHLVSDVPVGAFLSGGIDSSVMVAVMMEHMKGTPKTFTIGFGGTVGSLEDERPFAKLLADRYRTSHHELEVCPNLEGLIENIIVAFDEPFADDSSIPTFFVSKLAGEHVKVVLSGLGGDEIMGGYERYLGFSLSQQYQWLPGWFRHKILSPLVQLIPETSGGGVTVDRVKRFIQCSNLPPAERYFGYQALLGKMERMVLFSPEVHDHLNSQDLIEEEYGRYYASPNAREPMDRIMYQDVKVYLPDDILTNTDRISMAHSLEVRVPFLDHKLMEFCATIPWSLKIKGLQKKYFFRKAIASLLPREILTKKKQGFVGPMASWLRHDLKDYVRDNLSESNLKAHGYLNHKTISRILDEHFSLQKCHDTLIWALLCFQIWHSTYKKVGSTSE